MSEDREVECRLCGKVAKVGNLIEFRHINLTDRSYTFKTAHLCLKCWCIVARLQLQQSLRQVLMIELAEEVNTHD